MRIAAHRLTETGRWITSNPIALENRKCIISNVTEDEFHFILVCPMLTFQHYIPKYLTENPIMYKFIELLNNNNEEVVRRLGLYRFKVFEK